MTMPHFTQAPRTSTGFTLIELLTVIAVVSILTAILMPAISRARNQSHLATCSSQLRQVGTAIHLYKAEHNGLLPGQLWVGQDPTYSVDADGYPRDSVSGKLGDKLSSYLDIGKIEGTGKQRTLRANILVCPAWDEAAGDTAKELYKIPIDTELTNGSRTSAFGQFNTNKQPKMFSMVANPANSPCIIEADEQNSSRPAGRLPEQPVHKNFRNQLYFDGHVEAIEVE